MYIRRSLRRIRINIRRSNDIRCVTVERRDGCRIGTVYLPPRMTVEQYCRTVPQAHGATRDMLL